MSVSNQVLLYFCSLYSQTKQRLARKKKILFQKKNEKKYCKSVLPHKTRCCLLLLTCLSLRNKVLHTWKSKKDKKMKLFSKLNNFWELPRKNVFCSMKIISTFVLGCIFLSSTADFVIYVSYIIDINLLRHNFILSFLL